MKPIKDDAGTEESGIEGWGDELISKETGGIGGDGEVINRTYRKGYRPVVGYTIAVALSAALTGCASLGLTGNPIADAPAIAADVTAGCRDYAKIAAPLAIAPDPTLQVYVAFGGGLCDIATGNVLATAVPNIDKNTGLWITAITGAIQAASAVVPVAAAPAKP